MKVNHSICEESQFGTRRQRIHELLIALIQQQEAFSLIDDEAPIAEGHANSYRDQDPAFWLDRNRRVIKRYQALVRSAVTLDALMDAEDDGIKG